MSDSANGLTPAQEDIVQKRLILAWVRGWTSGIMFEQYGQEEDRINPYSEEPLKPIDD